MPTIIKTKNSVTATNAPSSLQQGEVAINITDKKVWVGNAATTPVQLLGAGATASFTSITTSSDSSISGLTVGKGGGAVATNTAIGYQAINASATGILNTAVGYQVLTALTSGQSNVGVGQASLLGITTGNNNIGIGQGTVATATTSSDNTAVGHQALNLTTSGASNTGIGSGALRSNTTASNNTAVGYQAAYANTTGTAINAFGYQTLYANTTGVGNAAFGGLHAGNFDAALRQNTTGNNNIAFGSGALSANTTGSANTSLGYASLASNTTASNNTAVGYQAGYTNATGAFNAYFGRQAGYLATGGQNTFIGDSSGYNSTGTLNSYLGSGAGVLMTSGSKNTIVGAYSGNTGGLDIRTSSNYIVLSDGDGNPRGYFSNTAFGEFNLNATAAAAYSGILNFTSAAVTKAQIYHETSTTRWYFVNGGSGGVYLANGGTSWTSASDERAKENLVPITDAVNKVSTLRAVTGNYIKDANKKSKAFLIAQDIQAVLPEAVDASDPEELGVSYTDVIPLLVAAIKELKAEIDQLKGN